MWQPVRRWQRPYPNADLAPTTEYTATITTEIQDLNERRRAGRELYVRTFTTAALPILVLPTVISTILQAGAIDVPTRSDG